MWREGSLPIGSGKLELLATALRLDGMAGGRPAARQITYESLTTVRVGRSATERISGRPSLILERRNGLPITIASISQPGVVAEIAERLAAAGLGAAALRRTVFVAPLVEGAHDPVRMLLTAGPPFELAETALDRHEVFLTPSEVVFVFESRLGIGALEPLLAKPELWRSAAAWRDHLAGPPRIAEDVYSWSRPAGGADQSLLPPGMRNGGGEQDV